MCYHVRCFTVPHAVPAVGNLSSAQYPYEAGIRIIPVLQMRDRDPQPLMQSGTSTEAEVGFEHGQPGGKTNVAPAT